MFLQNNKTKYVLAAAAGTGLAAFIFYKYSMTNDDSKLSEIDVLYNQLRKAIDVEGDEDWALDFEKMKIILKIVFSRVKQKMINKRRKFNKVMDYESWENIHN